MAGKLLSRSNAHDMPLLDALGTKFSAQRHRSVLIPLKILFWRLCDYRRPYRSALSPTSSPVARAAFLRLFCYRCHDSPRGFTFFPRLQTTQCLSLTRLNIPTFPEACNLFRDFSVAVSRPCQSPPWVAQHISRGDPINTGHFAPREFIGMTHRSLFARKYYFGRVPANSFSDPIPHISHILCTKRALDRASAPRQHFSSQ